MANNHLLAIFTQLPDLKCLFLGRDKKCLRDVVQTPADRTRDEGISKFINQ